MQKNTVRESSGLCSRNRRRRIWHRIVGVLACIVVFCTTYALILPAITMERPPTCAKQEHTHTESCYTQVTTASQEELVCAAELHQHSENCCDENGNLICGKAEHIHTGDCYQTAKEPADTKALTCQLAEGETHHHGPLCYGTWELTCGLEEHTHGLMCQADPEADVETPEIWEQTIPAGLRGVWREDVLAIAASQLGYRESERNFILDESGQPMGRTRYGECFGTPYGKWDAMLVSFCLRYAKVPDFPLDTSCEHWVEILQKEETSFFREKDTYNPRAGDLIFFDMDKDGSADHVGLIAQMLAATETDPVQIQVIEGGLEQCVQSVAYALEDPRIFGYGELPRQDLTTYQWSQNGVEVTVSFPASLGLPQDAQLTVEHLPSDNVQDAFAEAAMQAGASDGARPTVHYVDLLKISLMADGQALNPPGSASVTIRLLKEQYPIMPYTELLQCTDDDTALIPSGFDYAGNYAGSTDSDLSAVYAVVGASVLNVEDPPARAPNAPSGATVTPHKTIDAFREGPDNPDTNLDNQNIDKTDLYRLYLDAQLGSVTGNPVDLLIVVDQSGSMITPDMKDRNNQTITRSQAVRLVLNGTYSQYGYTEAAKKNGLIYQFLAMHPENQVAVVGFQGSYYLDDAETLLGWTHTARYVDSDAKYANGTNYCAGLQQAGKVLETVKNNGHRKILLFLSDGVPTYYLAKAANGRYVRYGNGSEMTQATKDASKQFFLDLLAKYPSLTTFTIGISRDITGTDASGSHSAEVLEFMAQQGGGTYSGVEDTDALMASLMQGMYASGYTQAAFEDTLSQYVTLYDRQPDYKLTLLHKDGTQSVLYENGGITAAGSGILSGISYDPVTRKVSAQFAPTYHLEAGGTYTLSFNVATSQAAYDYYVQHGYPDIGSENTDYTLNGTSSNQAGFYSNSKATFAYNAEGTRTTLEYPHPVVQAAVCKMVLQKVDSKEPYKMLPGAEFSLYRKVEAGGEPLEGTEGQYVKLREGLTSGDTGQIILENLTPGDYCLVETKAPDRYTLRPTPLPFTLTRKADGSGNIVGSQETVTVEGQPLPLLTVPNTPWGHELPSTGGAGTTVYTLGGLLMILSALLLLYRAKEKRRKEDFTSS